jgi:hypothetical protein
VCVLSCQRLQLVVARHYTYSVVKDLFCCRERQKATLSLKKLCFLSSVVASVLFGCDRYRKVAGFCHPTYILCSARLVGLGRLELPTSPLSGVRSNHLSYRPPSRTGPAEAGGAGRDRTGDLLNANQALSQLSYSPLLMSPADQRNLEADWTREAADQQLSSQSNQK